LSDPFACAGTVSLKPGREASVLRRHPWVYRGALVTPLPAGCAPLRVQAANGRPLGVALPGGSGGSLALRMVTFGDQAWDGAALAALVRRATALRDRLALDADAYRLVHAEGDGLPGLVIDRYGVVAVVEPYEAAWEPYLEAIASLLADAQGVSTVLVRPTGGAARPVRVLRGHMPEVPLVIREGRLRFPVDVEAGQKTGFFLDQRENRRRLGALAGGAEVLNLFSYSGGFAVAALAGGAVRAVNVDASAAALSLARHAYELNGLGVREPDFIEGDAFRVVRDLAATGQRYGVVVVDPPAFVKRRGDLEGGLRGYRDINLQALRLTAPGGLLFTCSCSALVSEQHFGQSLFAAALDARRTLRVLERRGAGPDHPVSVFCPEAAHLKAWLCAVD
jgi:23S rRNA (cytosine1962-C5)-methyltransferase